MITCILLFFMFVTTCKFVFFKQKTAYEMRISDWSSDVCSSDLHEVAVERPLPGRVNLGFGVERGAGRHADGVLHRVPLALAGVEDRPHAVQVHRDRKSVV